MMLRKKNGIQGAEFILMLIIYRLILDLVYENVISVYYAYSGFVNEQNLSSIIISWLLLLGFAFVLKKAFINYKNKLSWEIIYFLFLIYFVPYTTMVSFNTVPPIFFTLNTVYWIWLIILALFLKLTFKPIEIKIHKSISLGEVQIKLIALLFGITVFLISAIYTGFRINLDFERVYEFRAELGLFRLPVVVLYLFSFSRAVNTILMAYFIRIKNYLWVGLMITIQILSFGIDGSKSTFFLMIFVLLINILPSFNYETMNKLSLIGLIALSGISYLLFLFMDNIMLISLFLRRVLFVPVSLGISYVDFFTTHMPDYFQQSFLRHFGFNSDYPVIPVMISAMYTNSPEGHANNGLISDAITNLGLVGLFVLPLLIIFVLRLLDSSVEGLDPRIYFAVSLQVSLALSNTFLFSLLLTHGVLVTIFLLNVMRREPTT